MKPGLEFYQDKRNKWRWRLGSDNNKIIAASTQGYVNRLDCVYNAKLTFELLDRYTVNEMDCNATIIEP